MFFITWKLIITVLILRTEIGFKTFTWIYLLLWNPYFKSSEAVL